MSAQGELQAAIVAALRAALGADVSGVFDGAPPRAAYPFVSIEDGAVTDWSCKGAAGREHRVGLLVRDDGLSAARLHALMARVEAAIEGLGAALPGHRIASIAFVRARVVRPAAAAWAGIIEYRVRTLASGGDGA